MLDPSCYVVNLWKILYLSKSQLETSPLTFTQTKFSAFKRPSNENISINCEGSRVVVTTTNLLDTLVAEIIEKVRLLDLLRKESYSKLSFFISTPGKNLIET